MKKVLFILLLVMEITVNAQVGIGTTSPAASARLDVTSTTQGFLPPRMTTSQRDAIASPATGLVIYNTTTAGLEFRNGNTWVTTNAAASISGTLAVSNGGTGATTLAANSLLIGNGTSAVQTLAPNTNGNILYANGTNWLSKTLTINNAGNSIPFNHIQPYLAVNYCIATTGYYPSRSGTDPFIGEIDIFGFNFAPTGWALCDGSLLPISQNAALFSLLGTNFGGDGVSTFRLPNLQSRVAIGQGTGVGLSTYQIGQTGGSENITLTISNIPTHSHTVSYN